MLGMAAAASVEAAPTGRDRFAGVYKLVTYQRKTPSGEVTDIYGPKPIGRITYDKAGRMSAFLMRPGRKPPQDPREATLEEYREIFPDLLAEIEVLSHQLKWEDKTTLKLAETIWYLLEQPHPNLAQLLAKAPCCNTRTYRVITLLISTEQIRIIE